LEAFGYSSYYEDLNHNIFQFEISLINLCLKEYIDDTIRHEFAHMIHHDNYNVPESNTVEEDHSEEWLKVFIELGGRKDWFDGEDFYNNILIENDIFTNFKCACKIPNEVPLNVEDTCDFYELGKAMICPDCEQLFIPEKEDRLDYSDIRKKI